MRDLHKKIFRHVWKWAGQYRRSDKSIGVAWQQVSIQMNVLLADADYWIKNEIYPWDELGARFHHRLAFIHAFPNGNGRHARLATDFILAAHGQKRFSWGAQSFSGDLNIANELRREYITALKEADGRKFERLIKFVRT